MVIAVPEYTIVSVYERWGKCICSALFLYHQKDGTPFVLYSASPTVVSIMSKKQRMQTLNQDMQILLKQLKTRNPTGFLVSPDSSKLCSARLQLFMLI